MVTYAIKTEVRDAAAASWTFDAQKTMYGGKHIAVGDAIFVFASENSGGAGLVAAGRVVVARALPKLPGVVRQTPRVDITVQRLQQVTQPLGRGDLKPFNTWNDGRPQTELNFKLYLQATDKIVGLSADAAAWLRRHCGLADDVLHT